MNIFLAKIISNESRIKIYKIHKFLLFFLF